MSRVVVFFAWYDLWVGAYYDRYIRVWYICPLPCVVIKIWRRSKLGSRNEKTPRGILQKSEAGMSEPVKTFKILDPCDCMHITRLMPFTKHQIFTNHAEGCEHYDPLGEALEHIRRLVEGIEVWASDEDGVHYDCWDAYRNAVGFVDFQKAMKLPFCSSDDAAPTKAGGADAKN